MNDFEEFNVTPELTLDPFQEEKKEVIILKIILKKYL